MGDQKVEKSTTSDAPNLAMEKEPVPEKLGKNKFVLACTMLASMSSILLGYGECSVSPSLVVKDRKIRLGLLFLGIEEMPLFFLFFFQMRL